MDPENRKEFAALLRAAASQTIAEDAFWREFKRLVGSSQEHALNLALESAIHYWGNFHARNLLLMRVKPDRYQLEQGKNELNLIADALDEEWSSSELDRRLRDI